jgi:transcriptional antiterminator RfaH
LANLERQGYRYYLPRLRTKKIHRGRAELVTVPIFPRYLFMRLNSSGSDQSWAPISSTRGPSQLVHFVGWPAKVDDELVELMRTREKDIPAETLFRRCDAVLITDGPFAGIEAIYQTPNAAR